MNKQDLSRATLAGIIVLSGALTAFAAQTTQWYQWRGPNRDAISGDTGLLRQWPAGGPKLVWKATGLGGGFSGVSFWGDRIFTMGDKEDGSCVLALNRADGKCLWATKVGKPGGNDPQRPGTRCTPATDGSLVVALGQYGELVCVEAATGKEVWRKSTVSDLGGTVPRWNFSESPLLDGDHVICLPSGPKGFMAALKKTTGDLVWQSKEVTDNANYSSAIVTEIGGVRQYIAASDVQVMGVAASDGKVLWRSARAARNVIPTPLYSDHVVFISSGYNAGFHGFKITAENGSFKAEQIYADPKIANQHGGSILVGDHVYTSIDAGGLLTCIEFKTGKVVWQDKSVGKASLAYADGLLVVRSENGPVALVEATPAGYKEHGRFDQPDRSKFNSWPHPVIAGGCLYLRDQDVLLCYELKPVGQ